MKQFKVFFKNHSAIASVMAKSEEEVPSKVLVQIGTGLVIDRVIEVK